MIEIIMPKMGDAMEEGTLVEWLVKEGDEVKSGDVIGNIQTDKATVELTAPSTGSVGGFLIKAGDTVPVGKAIGAVLKAGEKLPAGWGSGNGATESIETKDAGAKGGEERAGPQEPPQDAKQEEPVRRPATTAQAESKAAPAQLGEKERVVASPLARRLAEQGGVSLQSVRGSGPNGRIVERDVREAIEQPATRAPQTPVRGRLEDKTVVFNPLKRITAERTAHSKQNVPHYYVTVEVDIEELESLRKLMNQHSPQEKLSINDFILKAVALALEEQPHINAGYEDGKMRMFGAINIGVAAAVSDGLTLPVVKNCEAKTLRGLAAEVRELIGRARENKLKPDELSGSTFAISNMGMFDVENFAAIIMEPAGAILAISTAKRVPVVVEGENGEEELEVRTRMKVTGSFDHRIIDGAVGATFMGVLRKYLEAPTLLLS